MEIIIAIIIGVIVFLLMMGAPDKDDKQKGNDKEKNRIIIEEDYNEYGELIETPYINGKKEGIGKWYYKSGELQAETPYINDKIEGIEKWYYESGALKQEVPYKNDKAEGIVKNYYESGALQEEVPVKNDKKEGIAKIYYESGALQLEVPWKNDNAEGIAIIYDKSGKLLATIVYEKNAITSGKFADGRPWTSTEITNWENGVEDWMFPADNNGEKNQTGLIAKISSFFGNI